MVRLILGRAGSGKTDYCLAAISAAVRRAAVGPPLIWILPQQGTFQAQRQLMARKPLQGTCRVEITSFQALQCRLAGHPQLRDENWGKLLRFEALLHRARPLLSRRSDPGTPSTWPLHQSPRELLELLEELSWLSVEELRQAATLASPADPLVAQRLNDLAILLELQREEPLDSQEFEPEELPASLRQARVWIDGLSALDRRELRLLVTLARQVRDLEMTLLVDPESPTLLDPTLPLDLLSPFYRTERLYRRLLSALHNARIPVREPLNFQAPRRFACGALARIERYGQQLAPPLQKTPTEGHVELWQTTDAESEVHAIARKIRAETLPGHWRYRHIGLIAQDLENYQPLIARIFPRYQIPFFLDQRRSLTDHPLTTLIAALLKLPADPKRDAWRDVLTNPLLPEAAGWLDAGPEPLPLQDLMERLTTFSRQNAPARSGHERLALLKDLLADLHVRSVLENWIQDDQQNDPQTAALHRQYWNTLAELLQNENPLSHELWNAKEWAEALERLLQSLTLGLIPPLLDEVLITSVRRSRHPELDVVFLLGALAPNRTPPENPLLNDAQRQWLLDTLENPDESELATSHQALRDAPFFDYVALTRARERLIVSYPQFDPSGATTLPAAYVGKLQSLFSDLTLQIRTRHALHQQIITQEGLFTALIRWAGNASPDDPQTDPLLEALYHLARSEMLPQLEELWRIFGQLDPPALTPELAARLYGNPMQLAVEHLDGLIENPMDYFFHHLLGIPSPLPPEPEILPRNRLIHRALEAFYAALLERQLPWPHLSSRECRRLLRRCFEPLWKAMSLPESFGAKIGRRQFESLALAIESQRRRALAGKLQLAATNWHFGPGQNAMPPLRLADGTALLLSGTLERIDAGPDGKSQLIWEFHQSPQPARSLAFAARLLAAAQARPQQVLLGGLSQPLQIASAAKLPPPGTEAFYQSYEPRGRFVAGAIALLDPSLDDGPGARSFWYRYQRTRIGRLAARGNDAMEESDFKEALEQTRQELLQRAGALRRGTLCWSDQVDPRGLWKTPGGGDES